MIKRTLYFGNPTYLSLRNEQLVVKLPEVEGNDTLPESFKKESVRTLAIEDIGVMVLDHPQITLTHGLLDKLTQQNVALITCGSNHLPTGLLLPLDGNTLQQERYEYQVAASLPLKKQLWQQTIQSKIANQAYVLHLLNGVEVGNMYVWSNTVKSGDVDNLEARAAAYYWANMFPNFPAFRRGQEEDYPNNLLNYGYAILRAIIARSLVASGLLPTLGIHHHNRYNAYCLADDIMEPYRPFVDKLVVDTMKKFPDILTLSKEIKASLLQVPVLDVVINNQRSPLMVATAQTTASLVKCFAGDLRKIAYPQWEN